MLFRIPYSVFRILNSQFPHSSFSNLPIKSIPPAYSDPVSFVCEIRQFTLSVNFPFASAFTVVAISISSFLVQLRH